MLSASPTFKLAPAPVATPDTGLLTQIADYIERHPARFNMYVWVYPRPLTADEDDALPYVGCLACYAVLLGGCEIPLYRLEREAQIRLGLSDQQALALFHPEHWPQSYHQAYDNAWYAKDYTRAARVAAAYVRQFVSAL